MTKKKGEKKLTKSYEKNVTFTYLPFHHRLKLCFFNNWIYLMIAANMVIFIWLMMPYRRPVYYNPGLIDLGSAESSTSSPGCFLPIWRKTTFLLRIKCLKSEFAEETIDLEQEIGHLINCQSQESGELWSPPNDFFHFLPLNILAKVNKKVISFSLYGKSDRYYRHVIRIIRRYKELLPDWTCRFWTGSDVSFLVINRLLQEDAEVIWVYQKASVNGTRAPGFHGMFWRFFIADDENVERYIVRDTDSMPLQREVDAINEWIAQKKLFHVMRDHREHGTEILGGMWGGKVDTMTFSASREYQKAFSSGYGTFDGLQLDQNFLRSYLWPIARLQMTCHSAYKWSYLQSANCKNFPTHRDGRTFVGAVIEN